MIIIKNQAQNQYLFSINVLVANSSSIINNNLKLIFLHTLACHDIENR